jgi:hypothetical protein
MDPATTVLALGLLGGCVIASILLLWQHRQAEAPAVVVPYRPLPISTDVINMASIKVVGVGGLGLVAMAATVALNVPRIFEATAIGLVAGTIMAIVMIVRRSH